MTSLSPLPTSCVRAYQHPGPPTARNTPLLWGGSEGVGVRVNVNITGPFEEFIDECKNMLVAQDCSSNILEVGPIDSKSEAGSPKEIVKKPA